MEQLSVNRWEQEVLIKRKIIISFISVIISATGLAASGCSVEWKPSQIPETGEIAGDFQLEDLNGNSIALNDFYGKPILLNFFATWCNPCREEIPLLETIHDDSRWQDEDLVILAVDIGEKKTTVKDFVEQYGISFKVLVDTEREVSMQYFVRGVPTTYFINRKGVIQNITIGAFAGVEEIEKNLNKIISGD